MSKRKYLKNQSPNGINAFLLKVCIFICNFLLIKRITQPSDRNTSGTAVARSLDEHSSSRSGPGWKSRSNCPSCTTPYTIWRVWPMPIVNRSRDLWKPTKGSKKAGYYTLTPESLSDLAKMKLPKEYVWLTFDDGVRRSIPVIYPLLKNTRWHTNNIITDFLPKEKENNPDWPNQRDEKCWLDLQEAIRSIIQTSQFQSWDQWVGRF